MAASRASTPSARPPAGTRVAAPEPLSELAEKAAFGRYTRYPLYEGDLDHILGAVHVKDLFRLAKEEPENFAIRSIIRDCRSSLRTSP